MVGQQILDRFPEILPRENDSIFRRYIEAHQEEMEEEYDEAIESVKISRQIEHASGEDLDRIGRMFGPVGRRTGRSDSQYRRYLKSVVQAFSGRGTDRSMREALAAALDIRVEDVQLTEDFEDVEYEVVLHDWTPHSVSNIYEISEIVDPSGVDQSDLRYSIPEADLQGVDEAVATDGLQVLADSAVSSTDTLVNITLQETFDNSQSSDDITQSIQLDAPAFVGWDSVSWDEFTWDDHTVPFNPTIALVRAESEVGAVSGDESLSDDDSTQHIDISAKYGDNYGQSYGTSPLSEFSPSLDSESSVVEATFFDTNLGLVTIRSDIGAVSDDESVSADGQTDDVIISPKHTTYGDSYGSTYGGSTLAEEQKSSDDERAEISTTVNREATWGTVSWDSFSWDSSVNGEADAYSDDSVSVTVNNV